MPDLHAERIDYRGAHLLEAAAPDDPFVLFGAWLADAFAAKEQGLLPEPTAMVVATVAQGRPKARTVLLKEVSQGGFVFFTNYDSHKGSELADAPQVALHFGWYPQQRQVRIEGSVARVDRAESEAYFAVRPRGSQLGAWASAQSSEVDSLEALTTAYALVEERFTGTEVPCPPHWGGFRVIPDSVEFWQGQPSRMHDRLLYRRGGPEHPSLFRGGSGGSSPPERWVVTRLAP